MDTVRRIALKVDCNTFEGTKTGLPNLLRAFDKAGIRASFFFTFGSDRSGRAIRRIFTQKGFLKKTLRSNAVSLYGPKTMLYGTLLPSPVIGKKLKAEIRSVADAGHEVGVHGWDHGRWYDLLYSSNTRLGPPHFPLAGKTQFKTLEIPTTLPTWDETLASSEFNDHQQLLEDYRRSIKGAEVHSIHTEVEGTAYLSFFEQQLHLWKTDGISFITMERYAAELLQQRDQIPVRNLTRITLPNHVGLVSSSSPADVPVLA